MRRKIMTIVGTRPEIIKLSRVIAELDRHTDHVLVHTGQNFDYELNEIFFNEMNIREPDYFLDAAGWFHSGIYWKYHHQVGWSDGEGGARCCPCLWRYE